MPLSFDDLVLVSVDDHMVEPPDMFEGHVAAKYRDRAPRIEERNGAQVGIHGAMFSGTQDRDCGLAMIRAYNDWHVEDWCGAHPSRFIPLAIIPYWDAQLAADEVRRMARRGCRVFNFCQNVAAMGLPSIHDRHWDPFFTAVCDEGGTLAVHLGTGGKAMFNSLDAPYSGYMAMAGAPKSSRSIC